MFHHLVFHFLRRLRAECLVCPASTSANLRVDWTIASSSSYGNSIDGCPWRKMMWAFLLFSSGPRYFLSSVSLSECLRIAL